MPAPTIAALNNQMHRTNYHDGNAMVREGSRWIGSGGSIFNTNDVTPSEIATTIGADFNVSRRPVYLENGQKVDNLKVLTRDDTGDVLSYASDKYQPFQNDRILGFFGELMSTMNLTLHAAGTLANGRDIWACAHMEKGFLLPGGDQVDGYMLLYNTHKPGVAMQVIFTTLRMVCDNMLNMLLHGKKDDINRVKVYHVGDFTPDIAAQATATLQFGQHSFRIFEGQAQRLAMTPLSRPRDYFKEVLGDPLLADEDQPKAVQKALDLYDGQGQGAALTSSRGTIWGGINAVTELVDHHVGRNKDAATRSQWTGRGNRIKQRAFNRGLQIAEAA